MTLAQEIEAFLLTIKGLQCGDIFYQSTHVNLQCTCLKELIKNAYFDLVALIKFNPPRNFETNIGFFALVFPTCVVTARKFFFEHRYVSLSMLII